MLAKVNFSDEDGLMSDNKMQIFWPWGCWKDTMWQLKSHCTMLTTLQWYF